MKHTKLILTERKLIAAWIKEGISKREFARRLRRNHATVVKKLAKNRFNRDLYEPLHAQVKANTRKKKSLEGKTSLEK